jgi:DNA-directed RNA polymerase subunit RPC12/RpoP
MDFADETDTYTAHFACGHARVFALSNRADRIMLQDMAAKITCPDCAYRHLIERGPNRRLAKAW